MWFFGGGGLCVLEMDMLGANVSIQLESPTGNGKVRGCEGGGGG